MSDTPKYLNANQVAELKGCTKAHVYYCKNVIGIAPGMPPGMTVFLESDALAWIEKGVGAVKPPWTDEEVVLLEALICKAVGVARNTPEVYRWLHSVGLPYWRPKKSETPNE